MHYRPFLRLWLDCSDKPQYTFKTLPKGPASEQADSCGDLLAGRGSGRPVRFRGAGSLLHHIGGAIEGQSALLSSIIVASLVSSTVLPFLIFVNF